MPTLCCDDQLQAKNTTMNLSLTRSELADYTARQVNFFFPDGRTVAEADLAGALDTTLDRLHFCFKHALNPRYCGPNGCTQMDHLYSDHYLMYLWFLANTLSKQGADPRLLAKIYYLNKALHAFDCMYDTAMPDVFLVFHGSGTMLGKAAYSNFFVALQGCTIGAHHGRYPTIGTGVALAAHSSIIGGCRIGNGVSVSCQTGVFETDLPERHIVYRDLNGALIIKPGRSSYAQNFFNVDIVPSFR